MVLINLLKPLITALAFVLFHVVDIFYNTVLYRLAQRISVQHIREIFVFNVSGSCKAQHIFETKFITQQELSPLLYASILIGVSIKNMMCFIIEDKRILSLPRKAVVDGRPCVFIYGVYIFNAQVSFGNCLIRTDYSRVFAHCV